MKSYVTCYPFLSLLKFFLLNFLNFKEEALKVSNLEHYHSSILNGIMYLQLEKKLLENTLQKILH